MKPKKLKSFAAAMLLSGLGLSGVGSAAAADLGVLDGPPLAIESLYITAPDVTFATKYFFALASPSQVSAGATNLLLSLDNTFIVSIASFNMQLFDAANNLLAGAGVVGNSYRIDDFALPGASGYYFQVSGQTSGLLGGSYSFAAFGAPIQNPVPEPATLPMLALGLAAISVLRLRSKRRA